MAKRTPESVTPHEVQSYLAWVAAHGIKENDGTPDADHNAEVIANYLLDWGVEWTRQNLDAALVQLRPHLRFYSPAQQSWNHASASITPADRQKILDYVGRSQHLNSEGDNLYLNAATFANFITEKRVPIQNLEQMVPQIVQSRYRLVTKTRLQDSEREAQANKDAAAQIQQPKNDEVVIPPGLNPALHEWYRQTHKPAKNVTPSTEASTMSHYEKLSRDAVNSIQSNNDRAEAERMLGKVGGGWTWQMVYNSIRIFIDKRSQQRASVGR